MAGNVKVYDTFAANSVSFRACRTRGVPIKRHVSVLTTVGISAKAPEAGDTVLIRLKNDDESIPVAGRITGIDANGYATITVVKRSNV